MGKAFRIAQLLALIGVAHLAFIMSSSRYWAETAGFVVGHMVLLAALVALFLGWSKRTRPYIPFAMLAFTAWMALVDIGVPPRGSEQMLDEFEAAVDRIERTYGIRHVGEGAGTAEVPETPPEAPAGSVDDRAMWAAQRTLYEYERLSLDYEGRYGLEAEHLEGWLEPHYFANASRYPEVPRYLARNRAAVEDMEQNFDRLMLERTVAVLNEADLPPAAREDFENSFLHGFRGSASRREQMYTIQKRWIATAEEFHQLLVENESVIRVNPGLGIAEIHDPWAEDRILDLYAEFQEQVERIADLQDEIMRDMRARIADGRQILR